MTRARQHHYFCTYCKTDWSVDRLRSPGPCPCCDHETVREIMVGFELPPIPRRDFDYRAWFDGEEESNNCGWGADANTAINDLINTYGGE